MVRPDLTDLPAPITATDELLRACVAELRGLRADLAAKGKPAEVAGTVPLREPTTAAKSTTKK